MYVLCGVCKHVALYLYTSCTLFSAVYIPCCIISLQTSLRTTSSQWKSTKVPCSEVKISLYCRSTLVPLLGSLTRYSAKGRTRLSVPGKKAELKASWLSVK